VGWRSGLLVVILVFAILFSMIYFSGIMASSEKERQIEQLQTATRADAGISRMTKPENICFTVDQKFLDKYPAFVESINEADYLAEIDNKTNSSYGNYYSNVALGLNKNEMLSLVSSYESSFNQATHDQNTPDGRFTHQYKNFSCGFIYQQRYYQLDFTFETLKQVNKVIGYVPVSITKELVEKKGDSLRGLPNGITFAPYNNTLVFYNQLPSPITIELINVNETKESSSVHRLETFTVLPNKMSDLRLSPNWSTLNDTIYHYKVREYPWIEGDIAVSIRYGTECMSNKIAKSLYKQSDFEPKFPSYLPQAFKLACNAENTDTYLIQIYVNQSAIDYHTSKGIMHSRGNPFPFYLYASTPEEEVKGIFQVHAMKLYTENGEAQDARKFLKENYQYLLNQTSYYPQSTPLSNLQFLEMDNDGRSYLAYNQGRFLSTVEVAMNSERYIVIGSLPMDEMMTIAKSLS
jgi:hypothetical protein